MTLVHRALFTWFIILLFCILLCFRLESRTHWNWFLVFVPLWIYDANLIIYVIIKIMTKWRNLTTLKDSLLQYQWYLMGIFLKIAAQIMICLKLEHEEMNLSIYVTMIPLWILLPSLISYLFYNLIKK